MNELGGYTVTVPALPVVVTQGETVDECLERAREAIALHIEGLLPGACPSQRSASGRGSPP
jgi:antitoxin HicB